MTPTAQHVPEIQLTEYIFADVPARGGAALFIGRVVEVRDKAVKVDYDIEPIFIGGKSSVTIFTKTTWIPKSVITTDDRGARNLKPWVVKDGVKGKSIRKYFINDSGAQIFV